MRRAAMVLLAVVAALPAAGGPAAGTANGPPQRLSLTGLYAPGSQDIDRRVQAVAPRYPLWTDGAAKRRWLMLPPGQAIDRSRTDAWDFPVGTKLWKEFAHGGRPVETRLMERLADGSWRYAAYVWRADGSDAELAPAAGVLLHEVAGSPNGRHRVPGRADCLACHASAPVPVLGVSAVQSGNVGAAAIAGATANETAALGYLHGNCGHCHNHDGNPAAVRLRLAQSAADPAGARERVLKTLAWAPSRWRVAGAGAADSFVVVPGQPDHSTLVQRMRSHHAEQRMPPLGTEVPDADGLALIERWITHDLPLTLEKRP
jgi:Planctomycete cytochrome C